LCEMTGRQENETKQRHERLYVVEKKLERLAQNKGKLSAEMITELTVELSKLKVGNVELAKLRVELEKHEANEALARNTKIDNFKK